VAAAAAVAGYQRDLSVPRRGGDLRHEPLHRERVGLLLGVGGVQRGRERDRRPLVDLQQLVEVASIHASTVRTAAV